MQPQPAYSPAQPVTDTSWPSLQGGGVAGHRLQGSGPPPATTRVIYEIILHLQILCESTEVVGNPLTVVYCLSRGDKHVQCFGKPSRQQESCAIVMDKAVGCYAYGNMFCWL